MNRFRPIAVAVALLVAGLASAQTRYEVKGSFPLQLSLFYPIQMVPASYEITGLKLNTIYGFNEHVVGLDLGVYGAGRVMEAIQVNLINDVTEEISGWQIGAINRSGSLSGLQTGVLNFVDLDARGLQIGLINRAADMDGLQIGLINTCDMLYGVQIGLVNLINDSELPFMLIINARF